MRRALTMTMMTAALAGCGGGGGGKAIVEVPFTAFRNVQPNQTVVMTGISQTVSGSQTTDANFDVTVTSVNPDPLNEGNTTVKLTYDRSAELAGLAVSTPQSSVSFQRSAGDTVFCGIGTCAAGKSGAFATAVAANPFSQGWDYQSFGIWNILLPPTSYQAGVASVGTATPGGSVPTSGTANFSGAAYGYFFEASSGAPYFTSATMNASADFSARSITFTTSATQAGNLNTTAPSSAFPGLDLNGTFSYAAGANQFAGAVNSANGLSGTSSGRFYGPNAEEIGGVYHLSGAAGSMLGGYGGKR